MTETEDLVRRYYTALDEGDYDDLEAILVPEFVQYRPDRTFETRAAFITFMRDGRPNRATTHELDEVTGEGERVTVRGRLLDADGEELFEFVDRFSLEDGRIGRLETEVAELPE